MTVGYQGEPGAFSEAAALELLGNVATRGYADFDALVAAVDAGEVERALLPCENSIHGSIARSYDLLYAYPGVRIVDETTHHIVQALIGVPGAALDGVRSIASHPVALEQCRRFLAGLRDVRVHASDDTAAAVRRCVEAGEPSAAAIGSSLAARRYGGAVLCDSIADETENYTRFFLIARGHMPRRALGRACIAFALAHRPGSLYEALGAVAARGINLRSLVARPKPKTPFEYVFYLELDALEAADALALAREIHSDARVLGAY
jgi:prephenate dehydratase